MAARRTKVSITVIITTVYSCTWSAFWWTHTAASRGWSFVHARSLDPSRKRYIQR